MHGREMREARAPGRARIKQLRPAESHDQDRMMTGQISEVVDEVEEARVSPLEVLKDEADRGRLCIGLEEPPPGGKKLLALTLDGPSRLKKRKQAGLHPLALGIIGNEATKRLGKSATLVLGRIALRDPSAATHHFGQGRERDSLAVPGRAPCVPRRSRRLFARGMLELPCEPALANSGDADQRDHLHPALAGDRFPQLLQCAQLRIAPHERSAMASSRLAAYVP